MVTIGLETREIRLRIPVLAVRRPTEVLAEHLHERCEEHLEGLALRRARRRARRTDRELRYAAAVRRAEAYRLEGVSLLQGRGL